MTHEYDELGYVKADCKCQDCHYSRLSEKYDTFNPNDWVVSEKPGFAFVTRADDLPDTAEAIYDEALLAVAGEETWKGGATIRLTRIRVIQQRPFYGEPGEVYLVIG